jgi:predicted PurR-regulated permease PerM
MPMSSREKMAFPDRRTLNIVLTILLFAILCAIVYLARRVILIFVFAVLFAYLIDPVVRFLQRHSLFFKNLRGPHIVEAYLAFVLVLVVVAHGVAPGFSRHARALFREVPALVDELSTGEIATHLASKYQWTDQQEHRLKTLLLHHREDIQGMVGNAERLAATLIGALFVIPILAIFFLSSGAQLTNDVIQLVSPSGNSRAARSLASDLNNMFRSYIRAKVILGGLSLLYCSAAMLVLGLPHAIALGVVAGVLEFVPVAGWMISATTIISVGVLTHSHWIWMAALLGLWRITMDYWIAPRVMGHQLEIHPLLAIFAFMVGGEIGGIVGIYLAVPLVAAIKVVWSNRMSASSQAEPSLVHGAGSA